MATSTTKWYSPFICYKKFSLPEISCYYIKANNPHKKLQLSRLV